MTNAEKYLKDGVIYYELAYEIAVYMSTSNKKGIVQKIDDFFKQQVKPILTEDERVILRNIDTKAFKMIGRRKSGGLYVRFYFQNEPCNANIFNDSLFQFIKNGEEYSIKELLWRKI